MILYFFKKGIQAPLELVKYSISCPIPLYAYTGACVTHRLPLHTSFYWMPLYNLVLSTMLFYTARYINIYQLDGQPSALLYYQSSAVRPLEICFLLAPYSATHGPLRVPRLPCTHFLLYSGPATSPSPFTCATNGVCCLNPLFFYTRISVSI